MKHVPRLFKRTFAATKNIWLDGVLPLVCVNPRDLERSTAVWCRPS